MDRISNLPDFILHHILSFLNNTPTELVRMSYVEYTTSRFCHHNITAHKLTLIATIHEPAELDIINRCLERLLNPGVRKLVIDFTYSSDVPKYRLPNTLLSVSVLTSLTIRHCGLPSSLTVDAVKFKSLNKLSLENVTIDDEVIKYLAASCPLLRVFEIKSCPGFKRFCVYGHQNLEIVGFIYKTPVERIDIEAPNLSRLIIKDYTGREAPQMNMALCKKLTTVTYSGRPLPNSNGFTDFLSNFPFIENLFLSNKYECNNLKLSSHSLRTLVLHSNCDVEGIEFSTPNLLFFGYSRNYRLLRPLLMDMKFTELEKLKAIELPPYELEHLELQLENDKESLAHIAFVDAVLWCCRPRSLTLRSSFPYEEQSDVVKFTYEKLLEQEKQGHTNVLVVSPSSSKAQKHLMDLKSSSMALPREGKASPKKKQDDETVKRHADMEILGCFGFRSCIFRTKQLDLVLQNVMVSNKMDRISHLPDSILHHILSFVNTPADLVRMSYTTSRFCHHNIIPAHKLTLNATIHEPAELDIINRCLERLLNKGVIKFYVYGHQNLQRVSLFRIPVEIIDIEAPNLNDLHVALVDERGPPQINLASCKKLTSLSYEGSPLPNSNGFLSNFPFLEDLALFSRYQGNNLKLSSHSLRTLEFNSDFELDEIELCTPSLGLFIYSCSEHYNHLGISHLPHLKACMRCYPDHSIDMLWLQKLRLFLDKENGFKAFNLYIHKDQRFIGSEKLKAIELPPYELEHIELHFEDQESSDHAAFVEAVLCCFRPQSLTLRSSFPLTDFEEKSSLVKFTYERLLEQENQGCTSIHILSPYSSKAQKHFRGLMLLPEPSPPEEKALSFIKEEDIFFTSLVNIQTEEACCQ
ncbi:hypothetical protein M8C21_009089, partial [Ambrosia artemisiifolia]